MWNKLLEMLRRYDMIQSGDCVYCAVSGGADSVALLYALYLLRGKLGFRLRAAHFNHRLRGAESERDEAFVRDLCARFEIPLTVGGADVVPGGKGLEAAARDARYAFFDTLPGKVATAHTADDNAETVLMRMVRGTGLKGLGGIAPVRGKILRPLLLATRQDVLSFLAEQKLPHVSDSSNASDRFLRNRLRHTVLPLLRQENPKFSENLSETALRLRDDEAVLDAMVDPSGEANVAALRRMPPALRRRALQAYLLRSGVREPEAAHVARLEALVYSEKPSASAAFPGGVTVARCYGTLRSEARRDACMGAALRCPGTTRLPDWGVTVVCEAYDGVVDTPEAFTVRPVGQILLRSRLPGDAMRLRGGTKSLKKLFIDRKIPAAARATVPVLADDGGVLGVYGIGVNRERLERGVLIRVEAVNPSGML